MELTTIKGYMIRHSDIQDALQEQEHELVDEWVQFLLGRTMTVIDDQVDLKEISNQGINLSDIRSFCTRHQLPLSIKQQGEA